MFKNLKSVSILNRQCDVKLSTALIMSLDVMVTLFGVYTFGAFFTVTITFEGRGVELGKGILPIGQVSCRTSSDWL
jgi:hypothetical protein